MVPSHCFAIRTCRLARIRFRRLIGLRNSGGVILAPGPGQVRRCGAGGGIAAGGGRIGQHDRWAGLPSG
jgi:hypothetical protein